MQLMWTEIILQQVNQQKWDLSHVKSSKSTFELCELSMLRLTNYVAAESLGHVSILHL